MDRDHYKRWKDHPLRHIFSRAADGDTVHDDELDDLRLPPRIRQATKQALNQLTYEDHRPARTRLADELSAEIVTALPPDHETAAQRDERRALQGDPDALARVEARERAEKRWVDQVVKQVKGK